MVHFKSMIMLNTSNDLVLIDYHYSWPIRSLISSLLLLSYLLTLTGNLLVVFLSWKQQSLHTPMYFFLCNLSLLEICVTSTITPRFLILLAFKKRVISFWSCMIQSYFYFSLGSVDFFLLAVMAFDRYAAICHPLHYMTIMNPRDCLYLACGCWIAGFINTLYPTILFLSLPFCGSNIEHFFCDIGSLLKLVCADIKYVNLANMLSSTFTIIGSLVCIIVSYTLIISEIAKIPSGIQRWKTISTCSSHLILVSLFYTGCVFMWLQFIISSFLEFGKMAVVLNTIITPMINPFIYTLRNNQVKCALKGLLPSCQMLHLRQITNV